VFEVSQLKKPFPFACVFTQHRLVIFTFDRVENIKTQSEEEEQN
jgi:hypothetical protein